MESLFIKKNIYGEWGDHPGSHFIAHNWNDNFFNLGDGCGLKPLNENIRYPNEFCIWNCTKDKNKNKPCCVKNEELEKKRAEQREKIKVWEQCKSAGSLIQYEENITVDSQKNPTKTNFNKGNIKGQIKPTMSASEIMNNNSKKLGYSKILLVSLLGISAVGIGLYFFFRKKQ